MGPKVLAPKDHSMGAVAPLSLKVHIMETPPHNSQVTQENLNISQVTTGKHFLSSKFYQAPTLLLVVVKFPLRI